MPDNTTQTEPESNSRPKTPPGYVSLQDENGHMFCVPRFLVQPTTLAVKRNAGEKKLLPKLTKIYSPPTNYVLAAGDIITGADRPTTTEEAASIHQEILALQEQQNLTYEDAANQLYMAEVVELRATSDALHVLSDLRAEVASIVHDSISRRVGQFDEYLTQCASPGVVSDNEQDGPGQQSSAQRH